MKKYLRFHKKNWGGQAPPGPYGRYAYVGRIAADAQSTHCGRRSVDALRPTLSRRIAADAQSTHCNRRSICRSNYASTACVECINSYCIGISRDFQCFATVTHASTHWSDRCDHSPNRPHAADARPTRGRRSGRPTRP